jgi:hypothetical protein
VFANSALAVYRFGDEPFGHLRQAAENEAQSHNCSDATKDKISGRMLSITWNEATGGAHDVNPAPMTMSRGDNSVGLWWSENRDPGAARARIFWHPGIGTWQMDDQGLGTQFGPGRFSSATMADKVADVIADRICAGGNIYAPWFACDNGACANDYDNIVNNGTLQSIDHSASIGTWGGVREHTCEEWVPAGVPDPPNFTCRYVKFGNATGYTSSWVYTPYNGTKGNLSPLAKPFYVYSFQNGSGNAVEARIWMKQDTDLAETLEMRRGYGQDSRHSLVYDSSATICDLDRGICSH